MGERSRARSIGVVGRRMSAVGVTMHEHVHATDEARFWPTFRPRHAVKAKRVGRPFDFDGRFYRDGYILRGADGRVVVLTVLEFEAIYEPAGMSE